MVAIDKFGRYEILRKLGRSLTDVYLAHDPRSNRPVVLKIIEHSRDEFTQLIIEAESRGAQIQQQLHRLDKRILEIYEFGEHQGCFFVSMEYFKGRTLAEISRAEGHIAPKRAASYAAECCNQLRTLHGFVSQIDGRKTAIIHGDIKPSNIQIGSDNQLKLLDFGIAKVISSTHSLTRHNLGSPSYCSPERLSKSEVDPYSDLWALGVTLYEMLSGSPPYQAQDTRKLENLIQSRRPPRSLPDTCPPALQSIVAKALAGDIARRYPSAADFEQDLRLFIADRPAQATRDRFSFWDANSTVETRQAKGNPTKPTARKSPPAAAAPVSAPPSKNRNLANIAIALLTGILAGLALFIPFAYYYRVHAASLSLRSHRDYARSSSQVLSSDWNLYQDLKKRNRLLEQVGGPNSFAAPLRANLLASARKIIAGYRSSSDNQLSDFDWARARLCLLYALQIEPADARAKSELALCDGYLSLLRPAKPPDNTRAPANFRRAATLNPASPDSHLALARFYIYSLHNLGAANAEFAQAEKLGFPLGPRELEQKADAYVYRAEWALNRASRTPASGKKEAIRWLQLAHFDLDTASRLYQPSANSSQAALKQVNQDLSQQAHLENAFLKPAAPKPRPRKRLSWFRWR